MKVYELNKDDVIIVKTNDALTLESFSRMSKEYRKIFPYNEILILSDKQVELSIVKQV